MGDLHSAEHLLNYYIDVQTAVTQCHLARASDIDEMRCKSPSATATVIPIRLLFTFVCFVFLLLFLHSNPGQITNDEFIYLRIHFLVEFM